ncbi:MAG: adenylosuccinate synthase [Kiritimatiellia bacterium]|jgi:adenylosuccinate synthase|nr:adenylosuccinate synthase [Kiritimatiellia bacterium]
MPNTILIGAQWGDEGKGKIIDVLTEGADWVVRAQGGNNAGHTVEVGEERFVLHLVPSGILHDGKRCVIGNGVVLDPVALVEEIRGVMDRGFSVEGRLFISDRAHVVFPYHRMLDAQGEACKAKGDQIGTTQRGIGPAYSDKAARFGLRMGDLIDPSFPEVLRSRIEDKNRALSALGAPTVEFAEILAATQEAMVVLAPLVCDTVPLLHDAVRAGDTMLFEGAQGIMLDIDFGTYPFVTSSNAGSGGAATGSGVPPNRMDRVVGVLKAYTTRVGEGPFPTELFDADGEELRRVGREFGATTGRPRRCGWFDAVVARHAVMTCGVDEWALTKLDVLDGFETLKICTAYELDGRPIDHVPANVRQLARCTPIYEEMPGWQTSTQGITRYEELPAAAQRYIARLEAVSGAPVAILSLGPRRDETIFREPRA